MSEQCLPWCNSMAVCYEYHLPRMPNVSSQSLAWWKTPHNDIVLVFNRKPKSSDILWFFWRITLSQASNLPRMHSLSCKNGECWKTPQNDIVLVFYRQPRSPEILRFFLCRTLSQASHLPKMYIGSRQSLECWIPHRMTLYLSYIRSLGLLRFWGLFVSKKIPKNSVTSQTRS